MKSHRDSSTTFEIVDDFYQDLLRFLLTHSEIFQGFFSFTESLLEHSYQIDLIYKHGQVFDENLYIFEDS